MDQMIPYTFLIYAFHLCLNWQNKLLPNVVDADEEILVNMCFAESKTNKNITYNYNVLHI